MKSTTKALLPILAAALTVGCGAFEKKINNKKDIEEVEESLEDQNKKQDEDIARKDKEQTEALASTKSELVSDNKKQDQKSHTNQVKQAEKNAQFSRNVEEINSELVSSNIKIANLSAENLQRAEEIRITNDSLNTLAGNFDNVTKEFRAEFEKTKEQIIAQGKSLKSDIETVGKRVDEEAASLAQTQANLKAAEERFANADDQIKKQIEEANAAVSKRIEDLATLTNKLQDKQTEQQSQLENRISKVLDISLQQPIAATFELSKASAVAKIESEVEKFKAIDGGAELGSVAKMIEIANSIKLIDENASDRSEQLARAWKQFSSQNAIAKVQALGLINMSMYAVSSVTNAVLSRQNIDVLQVPGSDALVVVKNNSEDAAEVSLVGAMAWDVAANGATSTLSVGQEYTVAGNTGNKVSFTVTKDSEIGYAVSTNFPNN